MFQKKSRKTLSMGANKNTHAGVSGKGSVKTCQMIRSVKEKVKARSEANVEPAAKRRGLDRSSSIERNHLGKRGVRQRSRSTLSVLMSRTQLAPRTRRADKHPSLGTSSNFAPYVRTTMRSKHHASSATSSLLENVQAVDQKVRKILENPTEKTKKFLASL